MDSFSLINIAYFIVVVSFCDSLPTEIVHTCMMASDVGMFINRERGFKVFFKPFCKCSCGLTNVQVVAAYPRP